MKNTIIKIKLLMYAVFMVIFTINVSAQIDPGTTVVTDPHIVPPHAQHPWENPPLCCDIPDMTVWFSTSTDNGIMPVFLINSGPLPIQEIQISLMDYHVEYNDPNCKPLSLGDLTANIEPWTVFTSIPPSGSPALTLQPTVNPPVNNSLTWTGITPINLVMGSGWSWNFNGLIALTFRAPRIVNLECCSGNLFYCFKVRIKDVNCKVCEKIVCGSVEVPKDKRTTQSIDKNQTIEPQKENSESPLDFFKRNKAKGIIK